MAWLVLKGIDPTSKFENTYNHYVAFGEFSLFYSISGNKDFLQYYTPLNDGFFYLEGVITNEKELFEKYKKESLKEIFYYFLVNIGKINSFLNELRGPFSGFFILEKTNTLQAFTNHYGESPVFYSSCNNSIVVSSSIYHVYELANYYNKIDISIEGLYQFLTYGYLLSSSTLLEMVYRIEPACILIYDRNIRFELYFNYSEIVPNKFSLDQNIDKLDELFRKAIHREFEKDCELGAKKHLVDLSGGLDSRIVSYIALQLGYDIVNISYSQSMSQEHIYAKKFADFMGTDFLHYQLDSINFVQDPEEIMSLNNGLALYTSITGGKRLLEYLNSNFFCLEHTGQLGDVIVGSYQKKGIGIKPNIDDYRINKKHPISDELLGDFKSRELFLLYTRGFHGILSSHAIRHNYFQPLSPFLDIDFMNFSLSIPVEMRIEHKIYYSWIEKKYPEILKIKSTQSGQDTLLNKTKTRIALYYHRGLYEIKRVLFKLGIIKKFNAPKNNMNPFRYWQLTSPKLTKYLTEYYKSNKHLIEDSEKIAIIDSAFKSSNIIERISAISVISFIKILKERHQ